MIDWHTSVLILAGLLGIALLWALWDTIMGALFAAAALALVRLLTWIRSAFRRAPPPPPE